MASDILSYNVVQDGDTLRISHRDYPRIPRRDLVSPETPPAEIRFLGIWDIPGSRIPWTGISSKIGFHQGLTPG